MAKVLCVGAAVVDFVFYLPELPNKPIKYGTERATIVGGGCAANAAVAVARLGGQAILGARMGDDAVGDLIVADLLREGVDVAHVTRTKGGQSSYSSIVIDQGGERQIVNFRGAGLRFDTDWFSEQAGLGAVLTDTRRVAAAVAAMQAADALGIPGIVDGEAPIDPSILHPASHVAMSMQGLQDLRPDLAPADALLQLAREFGGWFCVTDGANGVLYTDAGAVSHHPAYTVDVVDTLGAGDIWHGAFSLALAEGQSEARAMAFASAAAALKCMKNGGRAGCPNREDTMNFLSGEMDR